MSIVGDKETIHLYNHCHNGDVFYSRTLIEILKDKYNIKYYHNLKHGILSDLKEFGVEEIVGIPKEFIMEHHTSDKIINTWIGQDNMKYIKHKPLGCSYENNIRLIKDICDGLEIDVEDFNDYLPRVYFENLDRYNSIKNNMDYLRYIYRKIIFISNGNVLSSQSKNFDFTGIINKLSHDYSNYLFIVSSDYQYKPINVMHIGEISKVIPDLLQISYVSTRCDVIIGRCSGPYCYTHVIENILDESKTFIAFSNHMSEGRCTDNHLFNYIWSGTYSENDVYQTIKNNI